MKFLLQYCNLQKKGCKNQLDNYTVATIVLFCFVLLCFFFVIDNNKNVLSNDNKKDENNI